MNGIKRDKTDLEQLIIKFCFPFWYRDVRNFNLLFTEAFLELIAIIVVIFSLVYIWYLIDLVFCHNAIIILVLWLDRPSFKNLSLKHDRPSNLSLLLLLTNFLRLLDEQNFLCWLVLLPITGCPFSFSLFLSKTVGSTMGHY